MGETNVYTVSQVNNYVKKVFLKDKLLQDIKVIGEISNYKLHHPSGHMYFSLKDEKSLLRCVFFRSRNKSLKFDLAEGIRVIVRGSISLYERSGIYQLYVEEMEPEGLGELFLAYEQLKEKLLGQGLFDEGRKKPLPRIPQKIGLITSPSGAAVRDFLTTLSRRYPCVNVKMFPVVVQGHEAPGQIITALKALDQLSLDIIVITRGGGSIEELFTFNNEELVRSVYNINTPVVSAVGHETDFTLIDFVSDKRASTPTAAAEMIAPEKQEFLRYIAEQENRLKNLFEKCLKENKWLLERLCESHAFKLPREKIYYGHQQLDEIRQRLSRSVSSQLKFKEAGLENLAARLEALSPLKVLSRGFVYVKSEEKGMIRSVEQLRENQIVNIIFLDGEVVARIERKSKIDLYKGSSEG